MKRKTMRAASLSMRAPRNAAERKDLADWLRQMAAHVSRYGKQYASRVTAGLNYRG